MSVGTSGPPSPDWPGRAALSPGATLAARRDPAAGGHRPECPALLRVLPGLLAGSELTTSSGPVTRYAGIPYAQPPVGDLRFAAPQPAEPWQGTLDATSFGPSPMQDDSPAATSIVPGMAPGQMSEDCLSLNVWTPPGVTEGTDLPVLVWIYGGAFVGGGTALETYDAANLAAEQQVVVVSLNYRVGALGFGAPGVLAPPQPPLAVEQPLERVRGDAGPARRQPATFGEMSASGVSGATGTGGSSSGRMRKMRDSSERSWPSSSRE